MSEALASFDIQRNKRNQCMILLGFRRLEWLYAARLHAIPHFEEVSSPKLCQTVGLGKQSLSLVACSEVNKASVWVQGWTEHRPRSRNSACWHVALGTSKRQEVPFLDSSYIFHTLVSDACDWCEELDLLSQPWQAQLPGEKWGLISPACRNILLQFKNW